MKTRHYAVFTPCQYFSYQQIAINTEILTISQQDLQQQNDVAYQQRTFLVQLQLMLLINHRDPRPK